MGLPPLRYARGCIGGAPGGPPGWLGRSFWTEKDQKAGTSAVAGTLIGGGYFC